MTGTLERLADTLARMRTGRESLVDPIGVGRFADMLARAAALDEAVRGPTLARAEATLERLRVGIEAREARARATVEQLERGGRDVGAARSLLAGAELARARRLATRQLVLGRDETKRDIAFDARAARLAQSSGLDVRAGATLFEIAERSYRQLARRAEAALLVDRVASDTRTDVGRYHTETVARALLVTLRRVAPALLEAQLARLTLASELTRFADAFERAPEPVVEQPKRARKARAPRASAEGVQPAQPEQATPPKNQPRRTPAPKRAAPKSRGRTTRLTTGPKRRA